MSFKVPFRTALEIGTMGGGTWLALNQSTNMVGDDHSTQKQQQQPQG